MSVPPLLKKRLEALLGTEAAELEKALELPPCRALRLHPHRITREELEKELEGGLGEPIPFFPHCYRFEHPAIGRTLSHLGGAVYVQEPAAMAPVAALEQEPVQRILDLCAAPGGKSLQAATLLEENGLLVCNEPSPERRRALMQNLERMGEKRALVSGVDAQKIPSDWYEAFDLVICDAPCSGEGMLRKSEDAAEMWSLENVLLCAERQEKILESAYRACAPGGRILYSTCTWAMEENEEQVAKLLHRHEDLSLIPPRSEVARWAKEVISPEGEEGDFSSCLRFYPHRFSGEGQFLAVLRKEGSFDFSPPKKRNEKKASQKKPSPEWIAARNFLEETLTELPSESLLLRGETVYLAPSHPFREDLFVSAGVPVGTVQKGRILPHHRFFISYAPLFSRRISLSLGDPRIEAYLRGEEIPLEGYEKGWSLLMAERIPLGGIRVVNGRGKNAYPKGLRRNGG